MIIEKIEEALMQKEGHERDAHYPSDINACQRQLYRKWKHTPPSNPIEVNAFLKMDIGNAIHELVPKWLEMIGCEVVSEIGGRKAIDGLHYPVSYRIDNLFMQGDEMFGIEVKTSFGQGIKQVQLAGKPKENDERQVRTYMEMEPGIKAFYLVYIGRDNGYRTEFCITRQEWGWKDVIKKLVALEQALLNEDIPARDFTACKVNGEIKPKFTADKKEYKSDWQCSYCQWRDMCWEEIPNEGKWHGKERIV